MNSFKVTALHLILLLCFSACGDFKKNFTKNSSQDKFMKLRKQMVNYQIKDRGVTDSLIIKAFLKVPRHQFVPIKYRTFSYADRPLPIGEGQTISQPFIVAYMTEVLNLSRKDKVLEIGTGSGYQAAILGELCDSVFTIEIIESLGERAKGVLNEMGYGNIKVKIGDGYKGWEEYAPFDAIIVTCAPTEIPVPLQDQLAEGGRMIIPVGSFYHQNLVYLRKINGQLKKESVLPVRFVPMVDSTGAEY